MVPACCSLFIAQYPDQSRNTEIQRTKYRNQRRIYGACYLLHKTEIQKDRNREIERERICGSMLLAIYCTISRPRPSCYWSLSHIKLRLEDKNLNEKI